MKRFILFLALIPSITTNYASQRIDDTIDNPIVRKIDNALSTYHLIPRGRFTAFCEENGYDDEDLMDESEGNDETVVDFFIQENKTLRELLQELNYHYKSDNNPKITFSVSQVLHRIQKEEHYERFILINSLLDLYYTYLAKHYNKKSQWTQDHKNKLGRLWFFTDIGDFLQSKEPDVKRIDLAIAYIDKEFPYISDTEELLMTNKNDNEDHVRKYVIRKVIMNAHRLQHPLKNIVKEFKGNTAYPSFLSIYKLMQYFDASYIQYLPNRPTPVPISSLQVFERTEFPDKISYIRDLGASMPHPNFLISCQHSNTKETSGWSNLFNLNLELSASTYIAVIGIGSVPYAVSFLDKHPEKEIRLFTKQLPCIFAYPDKLHKKVKEAIGKCKLYGLNTDDKNFTPKFNRLRYNLIIDTTSRIFGFKSARCKEVIVHKDNDSDYSKQFAAINNQIHSIRGKCYIDMERHLDLIVKALSFGGTAYLTRIAYDPKKFNPREYIFKKYGSTYMCECTSIRSNTKQYKIAIKNLHNGALIIRAFLYNTYKDMYENKVPKDLQNCILGFIGARSNFGYWGK